MPTPLPRFRSPASTRPISASCGWMLLSQKLDFLLDGLSVFVSAGYANSSIYAENSHKSHQYGYERYTGAIGDKNNVAPEHIRQQGDQPHLQ